MIGCEHDKAEDEKRQWKRVFSDAVILRFKCGDTIASIAARYAVEAWRVEGILRDAVSAR